MSNQYNRPPAPSYHNDDRGDWNYNGQNQNNWPSQEYNHQQQNYNRPPDLPARNFNGQSNGSSSHFDNASNGYSSQRHNANGGERFDQQSYGQYNQGNQGRNNNFNNNSNNNRNNNGNGNGNNGYSRPPVPPPGMQYDHGMQYAYSNNTGKRKGLFIGINYNGSKNQLQGCINDAQAISRFVMQNFGYKKEDCVILTDDPGNRNNARAMPTRANIIDAMHWLVSNAQPNDSLIFHYSGHGSTVKDLDGDEETGYDETICPLDFEQAGMIVDDDMNTILVQSLPAGCRLTAFFDSCHSGSALDLPYTYSTKGALKEPNMLKDAGTNALGAIASYEQGNISGVLQSLSSTATRMMNGSSATNKTRQTKSSAADVISLSGCKDTQTSADASQGGFKAGAMSYSFLEVMSQNPNQSYLSLLQNIREVMRNKYSQKPQLSCSHPLDVNLRFTM